MEINITESTNKIVAVNRKTGERIKIIFLDSAQKQAYPLHGDKIQFFSKPWLNYSKRGEWDIFIDIKETSI